MPLLEIKLHLAHGSQSLPFGTFFFAVCISAVGLGFQDYFLTLRGLSSCPTIFFSFALVD